MIELQNVTKDFGEGEGQIHAVHDISLTIQDGEIFGIIGLSGAGKSTLVRCINLLERPTSGSVIVDGKDLTKLPQKELLLIRRSIGMIFQGFNLLAQRTVLQNVCYPLEIAGWKKKESVERAMELLSVVGLADRAKAYPSQLSGGQKPARWQRSPATFSATRRRARLTPRQRSRSSRFSRRSTARWASP